MMKKLILALLLGALMPLAFAPFHHPYLGIALLAGLFGLWGENVEVKETAIIGWFFGLGYFGFGVWWIFNSLDSFGQIGLGTSLGSTAILIMAMALYPMLTGILLKIFRSSWQKNLLVFPALWTLIEIIRSYLFTGFPWLAVGYTHTSSLLQGLAPLIGVYGLSFVSCFLAGCLVTLYQYHKLNSRLAIILSATVLFTLSVFSAQYNWTTPQPIALKAGLVQFNISQNDKWFPGSATSLFNHYQKITNTLWDNDIIIWPESSIPEFYDKLSSDFSPLGETAKKHNTSLIVGVPMRQHQEIYNGIAMLGQSQGQYFKRHLVPFGEYWPMETFLGPMIRFFDLPMSDFHAGPYQQKHLLTHGNMIAPFICYEIAYPQLAIDSSNNAHILLTITDDSWFGDSIALDQHLQIAQMRAMELQKPLIFSGNTGISGVINHKGTLLAHLPKFTKNTLSVTVRPYAGRTPWSKVGMYKLVLLLNLLLFGCWVHLRIRRV